MKRKDLIKYIKTNNIDKTIIGDSALVIHRIIKECNDVYPSDNKNYEIIDGVKVLKLEEFKNIDNKTYQKKIDLELDLRDTYKYEKNLRKEGIKFIAGVDEVGRGPLIGPVVAACVVLPEKFNLDGLTDSKKLSEKKREYFYDLIKEQALGIGIGIVSEKIIDDINIYEATKIAMKEAINNCLKECKIEHILIDAMKLDINIPTTSIIKGDLRSITISAASVIAKVTRDRMLIELDNKYPMYDLKNNKGYGTKSHIDAIKKYGIIDEHRKTFSPIKELISEK